MLQKKNYITISHGVSFQPHVIHVQHVKCNHQLIHVLVINSGQGHHLEITIQVKNLTNNSHNS
jgi:hypothetical protein